MAKPMKPMSEWVERDYRDYISRRKLQIIAEKEKLEKIKEKIAILTKEFHEFQDAFEVYKEKNQKIRKNAAKKNDPKNNPVGTGGAHHNNVTTPEQDAKLAAELCYPINVRHALLAEPDFKKRQQILRAARSRY